MKRVAIVLLQLLVTGAGLWYVFHDQQKRAQIADALRQADRTWIIFGWLSYSAVEVIATVRWQMLLRIQGITLRWLRTFAIVMIGLFFNMFLPGLVGGDAMRLYFVFKCAPRQKTRATLSVAMDRILGMLSILFLAGLSVCRAVSLVEPFGRNASYRLSCAGFARCWMCLRSVVVRICSFRFAAQTSETNAVSGCNHGIR